MIDIDILRTLLRYEPATGKLFWLSRPRGAFGSQRAYATFKTRFEGKEAMTATMNTGYRCGKVLDRLYLAHRVIWAVATGAWPEHQIDHINGDRTDNRLANLREATHAENCRNRRKDTGTTSTYRGVSWSTRFRVWRAHIRAGKHMALGTFLDEKSAALAYDAAAKKLHGTFAKLNFPT